MEIIKTTRQVENHELERKFTIYLSQSEMSCLLRGLLAFCVPFEVDEKSEEARKSLFGSLPEYVQKILIFITDDISKSL